MNDKPKITLPLQKADYIMEGLSFFFIIMMFSWTLHYYEDLPGRIPRHFNAAGQPDAYGSKGVLWGLVVVGTVMNVGLSVVARIPHVFNYPQEITPKNAARQYRLAVRMIRMLDLVISGAFFYIVYGTLNVAMGRQQSLGAFFLPCFLLAIFGTLSIYLYRARKT